MQQSTQLILDSFINYIKNINLHLQSLLVQNQTDFKNITNKTKKIMVDFDRFIGQYNIKIIQQIKLSKLTIPLVFYRTIKNNINDPNFMKYRYKSYQLKYIIIKINLQCRMHVEITKNHSHIKKTNIVFQKFENTFTYWLEKLIQKLDNQISLEFFKKYALMFLQQVYKILNGIITCKRCRKQYSYQTASKLIMPSTIRVEEFKEKQKQKQKQTEIRQPVYFHQNCLIDRPRPSNYNQYN